MCCVTMEKTADVVGKSQRNNEARTQPDTGCVTPTYRQHRTYRMSIGAEGWFPFEA